MILSIITPNYNGGAFLKDAIESVWQQFNKNIEHIIIDGASTDNSLEIIKSYPHLKWVSEPDKGIYDAMNKGLQMARGEWVYFLGADDQLYNGICSWFQNLEHSTLDMIYGNIRNKYNLNNYGEEYDLQQLLLQNICHQAIFVRNALIKKEGGFNTRYKIAADWEMNIRIFANSKNNCQYFNKTICIFNENGLSSQSEDITFLKEKLLLFTKATGKKITNAFFHNAYQEEFIFQARHGSILKAFRFAFYHIRYNGKTVKTLYTLAAFLKQRIK